MGQREAGWREDGEAAPSCFVCLERGDGAGLFCFAQGSFLDVKPRHLLLMGGVHSLQIDVNASKIVHPVLQSLPQYP